MQFGALRVRGWSKGCEICWKGAKMVLFVTGLCQKYQECPYCTITPWKRERDIVMADEVLVSSDDDVIREARLIEALGAGITGGEPSLFPERVEKFVRLLKSEFGADFHIHLYTNSLGVSEATLAMWADAGLDEIRFHCWDEKGWEKIRLAVDYGFRVGAEMPSIPGSPWENRLKDLALFLDRVGAEFLNLNELEFTEGNRKNLLEMGFRPRPDSEVAAQGSSEAARRVLEFLERETSIWGYFCPAAQKDYQMWMRWKRRAKNVAKPYESVDESGSLVYGVLKGDSEAISKALDLLLERGVPPERISVEEGEVRVAPEAVMDLAELLLEIGVEGGLVEVAPLDERLVLAEYPLEYLTKRSGKRE